MFVQELKERFPEGLDYPIIYDTTVFIEETENALVDYGHQQDRRDFLKAAAEASEKAAELARQRFEEGGHEFSYRARC